MFTTLMIVSTKQGMIYDAEQSAKAFAVIERLVGAVASLVNSLRNARIGAGQPGLKRTMFLSWR